MKTKIKVEDISIASLVVQQTFLDFIYMQEKHLTEYRNSHATEYRNSHATVSAEVIESLVKTHLGMTDLLNDITTFLNKLTAEENMVVQNYAKRNINEIYGKVMKLNSQQRLEALDKIGLGAGRGKK